MTAPLPNALTMGEPAGIGAELTLKTWAMHREDVGPFFVIDDPVRLRAVARTLGIDCDVAEISSPSECTSVFASTLPVLPLDNAVDARPGNPDPANAAAVLESIQRAVTFAMNRTAGAIVTNPIQKDVLYKAGFTFPGHTEYLADLTGAGKSVMMLASPMLRVVPVTVHVSLAMALAQLSSAVIAETGTSVIIALKRDFGIAAPRLAVAGLNPHAGESGSLGNEEQSIIGPAISALRDQGVDVFGPVPPDALFTPRIREKYDAALCMYHDQALIPIKALDVDRAVNVTLGLPVVRTSPDHGTALDIAGKGIAEPASLVAAMKLAGEIAANRQRAEAV